MAMAPADTAGQPPADDGHGWPLAVERLAIAIALGALVVRFLSLVRLPDFLGGGAAVPFSYDEATYVDLAHHPWRSSFYPDPLFLRHPPLYFWTAAVWGNLVSFTVTGLRFLSLLCAGAAVMLVVRALHIRAGTRVATVGALLLAAAIPLHVYLVQATMYAMAMLWLALAVYGRAAGRERLERNAMVLLCLTHLFGFVYLALWVWERRADWRLAARQTWPATAWLGAASVLGLVFHGRGLLGLGPAGQVLRTGMVLETLADGFWEHLAFLAITLLVVGPLLLLPAWAGRRAMGPWATGALAICLYFAVAPPFLRYSLLVLPALMVAGLPALFERRFPVRAAATLAIALLTVPLAQAYWVSDAAPSAANDVPGLGAADEAVAAALLIPHNGTLRIGTQLPTAVASYLIEASDGAITNNSAGPERLAVGGAGVDALVLRLNGTGPAALAETPADVYFVPIHWDDEADLAAQGFKVCARVTGLLVVTKGECSAP
jgi:hypothetical protein